MGNKKVQDIELKLQSLLDRRRRLLLKEAGVSSDMLDADIYRKVRDLSKEHKADKKTIKAQEKTILSQEKRIKSQETKIAKLEEQLAITKARLEGVTLPKTTSKNSSLPPSKNPLSEPRHTNSLRQKSDKETGGQIGHPGTTHAPISDEDVTEKPILLYPLYCPFCGHPVDMSKLTPGEIRFMIDFPSSILPQITKYIQLVGRCENCGKELRGEFPDNVSAPIVYGPHVEALIAYLSTFQDIPFKRMVEMLDTLFGIPMSQGTVSNILQRMRKKAKVPMETIRQIFLHSKVGGADESGLHINGDGSWMWVFQTETVTYMIIDRSRGEKVPLSAFPEGLKQMILVTDRWQSYFNLAVKDHQICIAHLLRNTFYFVQLLPNDPWPVDLMELFREAIRTQNEKGASKELRREYDDKLIKLLDNPPKSSVTEYQKKIDTFAEGLRKHKDHIFTFLEYQDVPADNNASERAVRPLKTKMKVSGQFKSEDGAAAYATLFSIVQTARKNGQNPYLALLAVAEHGGQVNCNN